MRRRTFLASTAARAHSQSPAGASNSGNGDRAAGVPVADCMLGASIIMRSFYPLNTFLTKLLRGEAAENIKTLWNAISVGRVQVPFD